MLRPMSAASQDASKRLLILASKLGYQTRNFAQAAQKLSVEVVFGTDRCHQLDDPWADGALALHFEQPEQAAGRIVEQARAHPISAILALGDRPTTTAAYAARALGLPYNSPGSVEACRSKLRQRERSEEHTSELQSLAYLVCRLLLEKKNDRLQIPTAAGTLRLKSYLAI